MTTFVSTIKNEIPLNGVADQVKDYNIPLLGVGTTDQDWYIPGIPRDVIFHSDLPLPEYMKDTLRWMVPGVDVKNVRFLFQREV